MPPTVIIFTNMADKNYQPVIGLEIHIELKTDSKMFCGCPANYFGQKPNTLTCPVCLGLPGALPVPNKKAIEWAVLIGKALNCSINKISKFDRKHYFYPDLPKGYQISQYDEPLATNGQFSICNSQCLKKNEVRIRRVHLEEDTAKLIHSGKDTLIDFNRSGVPLVEIVTEPDFDNSDDVKRFLEELQVIVRYLDVSDASMEKGSMRLEPNISVKHVICNTKHETSKLPAYKVEVKNINSFRFVKQAIDYEVKRQIGILETGQLPKQETRGFDADKVKTYSQRTKEEAHDYRYFPEPDIPPLDFDDNYLSSLISELPELPHEKLERYIKNYGLRYQDAFIITRDKKLSGYFERVLGKTKISGQEVANLIVNKKINTRLPVDEFVKIAINLIKPKETNIKLLDAAVEKIINQNPQVVADYKSGKKNAIMFLVGQVMREMKSQAEAKLVIEKLKEKVK